MTERKRNCSDAGPLGKRVALEEAHQAYVEAREQRLDAELAERAALDRFHDLLLVRGNTTDGDLVRAKDAPRFGLSPRQFREAIRRGDLPATERQSRRGKFVRVEDLRAHVEAKRVIPKAPRTKAPSPSMARARTSRADVDRQIDQLLENGRLTLVRRR